MATATPIRIAQRPTTSTATLFLAFELRLHTWKLGFTHRERPNAPGSAACRPAHIAAVREEIPRAKQRFGLPADAPVISCYEAGRDGFWLHRW